MRIGCLQFAPKIGDVGNNLNRADLVINKVGSEDLDLLDLLVLPELAFSGSGFKSLHQIDQYLEPTTSGISSLWTRSIALKHNCVVTVGYPEKTASLEYHNSSITVNGDGETIAISRKLFVSPDPWALGGDMFFIGQIAGLGNVAMGIGTDLAPYWHSWHAQEFAYYILHHNVNLVILPMAWLTRENAESYSKRPNEPDMETLGYWISRLEPLIRAKTKNEIIVVLVNRCGFEGEAVYAGTSAVLGIQDGEVRLYGILGRDEKKLLVVDTESPQFQKIVPQFHHPLPQLDHLCPFTTSKQLTAAPTTSSPVSVTSFLLQPTPFRPASPKSRNARNCEDQSKPSLTIHHHQSSTHLSLRRKSV